MAGAIAVLVLRRQASSTCTLSEERKEIVMMIAEPRDEDFDFDEMKLFDGPGENCALEFLDK